MIKFWKVRNYLHMQSVLPKKGKKGIFKGGFSGSILEGTMDGTCYQWAFDFMLNFMWRHSEADPDQYKMCVGIVRDPESGKLYDHAWIEDTATGGILYKLKSKRRIERKPKEEYCELMNPRYVKSYSGREMVKRALKAGVPGLLANVPSKILAAPDYKGHWDDAQHPSRRTVKVRSGTAKTKSRK